jgi:hypothetical protein
MSPQLSKGQQTLGMGLRLRREPPQAPPQAPAQAPSTIDLSDFNNHSWANRYNVFSRAYFVKRFTLIIERYNEITFLATL